MAVLGVLVLYILLHSVCVYMVRECARTARQECAGRGCCIGRGHGYGRAGGLHAALGVESGGVAGRDGVWRKSRVVRRIS